MEPKSTPSKSAIQYGFLFGVIMILQFVILYVIDIDPITHPTVGVIVNLLNYLILPAGLIFVGCTNYKKNLNGGFISFGQCLKIGVSICMLAGLLYALFSVVFNLIFPDFMEEVLKKTQQVILKQNPSMPKEQLETAMAMTKKFMQPVFSVPATVAMFAFIGLLYSLLIGAFVKNEQPQSL